MKDFIENIEWYKLLVILLSLPLISWIIFIVIYGIQNEPPKYGADTERKIKICRTYSNDFWRNDIDFIDGKCYYKGKEVEMK